MTYFVNIGTAQWAVSGIEAAWATYRKAADLADILGEEAVLCTEYGEVIQSSLED